MSPDQLDWSNIPDPKWPQRFMGLAWHVASFSRDPSTQVGAVVADGNRIVSVGFNGFARGVDDAPERYADRDIKYKLVVHAEVNAVIFARGDLWGRSLYTWPFLPCCRCAAIMIQAGISKVIAPELLPGLADRWAADIELTRKQFTEAGVRMWEVPWRVEAPPTDPKQSFRPGRETRL